MYPITVTFLAATFVGAWTTAMCAYVLHWALHTVVNTQAPLNAIVSAVAAIIVVSDFFDTPFPIPSTCWLIPRAWAMRGPVVFAALFGVNIGFGWRTRVVSHSFWLMIALAICSWNLSTTLLAFTCFGAVRAIPVVLFAHSRDHERPRASVIDTQHMKSLALNPGFLRSVSVIMIASVVSLFV